jgi:D-3-phosphoglycerate dehydrogenase / 2-oxoglutarate reductase
MLTVLFSAPYMIPYKNRFQPVFKHYQIELIVPDVKERLSEAEILKYAGSFDGAICGDDRYTKQVIEACLPRLRIISKWGTGVDSIDQQAAKGFGVKVGNTPNAFTQAVADSVFGYILAFSRKQPWMDRELKSGKWEKIPGKALHECILGIIGIGNIGKAISQRALGFNMKVIGNDLKEIDKEFLAQYRVDMVSLENLLMNADFVSVNADLNPTSHHLMNKETIAKMKPTAILINTARGPIIDERALTEALQNKKIAGVGLDVFEEEPLPASSPLKKMDNVLLAPHNSNSSPSAWENVHWNTIRNLIEGLGLDSEELDNFRQRL